MNHEKDEIYVKSLRREIVLKCCQNFVFDTIDFKILKVDTLSNFWVKFLIHQQAKRDISIQDYLMEKKAFIYISFVSGEFLFT